MCFEFLSTFFYISNKWIILHVCILRQSLSVLCLNICQGMEISWIDTGCQDIIFSVILYTAIILILKQLCDSYSHFCRLVIQKVISLASRLNWYLTMLSCLFHFQNNTLHGLASDINILWHCTVIFFLKKMFSVLYCNFLA